MAEQAELAGTLPHLPCPGPGPYYLFGAASRRPYPLLFKGPGLPVIRIDGTD